MLLVAYVTFAILQTSFALPTVHPELSKAPIDELANSLPKNELQQLKLKHLQTDPTFQAAVKYFQSPEWVSIVAEIRKNPEWIQYKEFIKDAGFDLDYLIQHLEHCLNATDTSGIAVQGVKPSLTSFFDDVKMTYGIPIMKGVHAYMEKVGESDGYKKFVEKMVSPKSKELLEKAMEQPALKNLVKKLQEMDVNVDYLLQMVYTFSGWQPLKTA